MMRHRINGILNWLFNELKMWLRFRINLRIVDEVRSIGFGYQKAFLLELFGLCLFELVSWLFGKMIFN
jgi:hypothetical protein